jgi:hypothetical protein
VATLSSGLVPLEGDLYNEACSLSDGFLILLYLVDCRMEERGEDV